MRTSGRGPSDLGMTAVPLAILVVFLMVLAGGPKPFLMSINRVLQSFADWVVTTFS
jgi:hypothetical protein